MFQGPDPAVLKDLCAQAQAIMEESDATWLVTDDWSPMVPAVKVDYDQSAARQAGISRSAAGISVMAAAGGIPCGTLNDGAEKLGIYIRSTGMDGEPACGEHSQRSGMGPAAVRILRSQYGDRPGCDDWHGRKGRHHRETDRSHTA